jgi:hypothetical protein
MPMPARRIAPGAGTETTVIKSLLIKEHHAYPKIAFCNYVTSKVKNSFYARSGGPRRKPSRKNADKK